jgi:hypothetical protein
MPDVGSAARTVARPAGPADVAATRSRSWLRPWWWAWAALGACAAILGAVAAQSMLPGLPGGQDYTSGFAPWWATVTAATLGAVAMLPAAGWPRVRRAWVPRRVVLAAGWGACVLLVWSAAGVVFDVLRVAAVLGIPGLPPVVDWPGLVTRAAALGGAALLAPAIVCYQRASRGGCAGCGRAPSATTRPTAWLGYAAFGLAFPYPLLKLYWALGGALGWGGDFARHGAVGETLMLGVGATLSLALVQQWGRVVPRWVPLVAGKRVARWLVLIPAWAATAVLVTMGALVAFGSLSQALGLVDGPARFSGAGRVVFLVYGGWLLFGLALGGATWAYQQQTRARCGQCGR